MAANPFGPLSPQGFSAVTPTKPTPAPRTRKQRQAFFLDTVDQVHSGQLTEAEGGARLTNAGFPNDHNPFVQDSSGLIPKVAEAVGTAFTPHRKGRLAAADTARAQAGIPNAGIVMPGTGLAAQVLGPLAQGAVYGPGGVVVAVAHPGRTAGEVYQHLRHPNAADAAFLGYVIPVAAATTAARLAGATQAIRAGEGFGSAVTRSSEAGGSLLHTPRGAPVTINVLGPEPPGGIGPREGFPIQRPVSRNVLRRPFQRARGRAIQRGINREAATPGVPIGRFRVGERSGQKIAQTVSARTTVARELRAKRRVEDALANALANDLMKISRKLNRGEHAAVSVVGIAGDQAITDPAATVATQIATHEKFVQDALAAGAAPEDALVQANRHRIDDLKLAQVALENPSPRLKKALALAAQTSQDTEARLIAAGHLTAEQAQGRVTNLYRTYHGAEYVRPTAARLGRPSSGLVRQRGYVERLQGLVDKQAERVAAETERLAAFSPMEIPRGAIGNRAVSEGKVLTPKGGARLERLSAGLSVAKERLATMENAAAARVTPTGFVGGQPVDAPPGSFYFPLSRRYQPAATPPTAFPGRPGPYGKGPVATPPELRQAFTGASVEKGALPAESATALAIRARVVNGVLAAERQFADLFRIGSPVKQSIYDIGIRDTPAIREELKQFFRDLADTAEADPAQLDALSQAGLARLEEHMRFVENVGVGESVPGVKWVDRRYLYDLGHVTPGGVVGSVADAINNPLRISQLYLRPAYVLNLLGNLGMNGITEGVRIFPALRQATLSHRLYGDDVTRLVDAGMGASLSRSFSVPTGVLHDKAQALGEAWNSVTDLYSRRGAFFGEAAREGFKTPTQVKALLTDPAHAATRIRIFRTANRNIVDYNSLTPFEANEVRRAIYFYPWVSRATVWTLRVLAEHPGKSFTLFELGQVGSDHAHRALGKHLPRWADELGLIPAGSRGGLTSTYNPSSVYTPTSAVQAVHALSDFAKGVIGLPQGGGFGETLTPAASMFLGAGTPTDPGSKPKGLIGLVEQQPLVGLAARTGLVPGLPTSQTYPGRGPLGGAGPFVLGGLAPPGRPISRARLGDQALREASTPRAKALMQLDQAAEWGVIPQASVAAAKDGLGAWNDKQVSRLRAKLGSRIKAAQGVQAEVSAGRITAQQAAAVIAQLADATDSQVDALNRQLDARAQG